MGSEYLPQSDPCTESDNPDYAIPDHIEFDDEHIYGSTRNSNNYNVNRVNLYIWRISVTDGLLSQDSSDFFAI